MRKPIISLLLASVAATPALAERPDRGDRQAARAERQQANDDRKQAREDKPQPRQERQQVREERQQVRADRANPAAEVRQASPAPAQAAAVGRANRRDVAQIRAARPSNQNDRNVRVDERQRARETLRDNRQLRQSERAVPPVLRNRVPVISNVPRAGTQPPLRTGVRHSPRPNWSTSWRHNSRYDWQNWRSRNRSIFHLGFYSDPFGWGYQPYSIGWRLWPSYYRSSYWLSDPWQYRLPYAPPGTRWIRYYDDAILVDTWTGEVVDVLHNFFW